MAFCVNKSIMEYEVAKSVYNHLEFTASIAQTVVVSALSAGGRGFDSRSRHTKDVNNGTGTSLAWHSVFIKASIRR